MAATARHTATSSRDAFVENILQRYWIRRAGGCQDPRIVGLFQGQLALSSASSYPTQAMCYKQPLVASFWNASKTHIMQTLSTTMTAAVRARRITVGARADGLVAPLVTATACTGLQYAFMHAMGRHHLALHGGGRDGNHQDQECGQKCAAYFA